jgi:hypothetical protein
VVVFAGFVLSDGVNGNPVCATNTPAVRQPPSRLWTSSQTRPSRSPPRLSRRGATRQLRTRACPHPVQARECDRTGHDPEPSNIHPCH